MSEPTKPVMCNDCGKPVLECWCFADDLPTADDFDPDYCLCGEPIDYRCKHGLCKNCGNCNLCEELDRYAARQA